MRGARTIGAALLLPALLSQAVARPVPDAPAAASQGTAAARPAAGTVPRTPGGVADDATVGVRTTAASGRTAPGQAKRTGDTVTTEPVLVEPVLVEPVVVEPVPEPTGTTEPDPAEPPPAEPTTTGPTVPTVPTEPAPTEPAPATPVPSEPAPSPEDPAVGDAVHRVVPLGVTVPWGPLSAEALAATTATAGVAPSYLQWYTGWGEAVDVTKLQAVVDSGAVPVVTWEPWVWTDGVDQPRFAMSTVVAGDHDAYLTAWADALAAWGGPVLLRFAHEANGSWYPWAAGVNGNTAADHVAAWRHVHDLFAARGADSVQWVWAPNVVYPGSTPLASLYPGDAYVDVVGVDGYNWGTSVTWERWRTPAEVFDPTFAELRALAPGKPLLVTETASAEVGGDKAAWIGELFTWAAAQRDLAGIIWFDENKETDWRIASSPESAAAFREVFDAEP